MSKRSKDKCSIRKPKQERAKFTFEAIVEGCARVLACDGWSGLSTNRIAERAGVSIGTLYEYFPNKEAIVEVLLQRHISQAEARLEEHLLQATDPSTRPLGEWISLLVTGFVALHEEDPRLHRRLSSEVPLSVARSRGVTLYAGCNRTSRRVAGELLPRIRQCSSEKREMLRLSIDLEEMSDGLWQDVWTGCG